MACGHGVSQTMEDAFRTPPAEAKPIMIWQWMDGLVSQEGITADLEAYKTAGIGGVQNFQVGGPLQGLVKDTANDIGTERWKHLMKFAIDECARLGLSFGTHNCPGWSSSAYPTVEPEYAMQKLVWRSLPITSFKGKGGRIPLPEQPEVDGRWGYYEDIAVLLVPDDSIVKLEDICVYEASQFPLPLKKLWSGNYCIYRFGHTAGGKTNQGTAPESGVGLECDKMSREAVKHYWDTYPSLLIELAGNETGKTFQRLEIDSYEAGGQEWTKLMPEEFKKRRGYDITPWLLAVAGVTIDNDDATKKFWKDWQETVSDLFAENYYGYMSTLAHQHGLQLLVQPYGTGGAKPFSPINTEKIVKHLAADDPISAEFWTRPKTWGWSDVPRVVNAARQAGHRLVYAEGFTCWPLHAWKDDPASLKAIADSAFCMGINKLMLHAGAHNPWVGAKPGMTFGMWGTQWTPGQTWWKDGARPLFDYFTRCQTLLQRGDYVDGFSCHQQSLTSDVDGIQWIHRRDKGCDIYFIVNTTDMHIAPILTVNVNGMLPEIWNPETSDMTEADAWTLSDGRTMVSLSLEGRQSLFIVFRQPTTEHGPGLDVKPSRIADQMPIDGEWSVDFGEGKQVVFSALKPWDESADDDIKYFSGTACCRQTIYLKELNRASRYVLDLGEVKNLATVKVNGHRFDCLWRPPFRVDITDALMGGENILEVEVTNLWVNRMIGDEQEADDVEWSEPFQFGAAPDTPAIGRFMQRVPDWLRKGTPRPSSKRKAVISFKFFEKDAPLLRSGLLGPVTLIKQEAKLPKPSSVEKEFWIKCGERKIYGILSTPNDGKKKHPLVIVAHGFNGTYHHGRNYFKTLADLGYQCYTFDFPCGSLHSRSDNNTMEMSVLDEQRDLESIVRYFMGQADVDRKNIVLLGGSQGGLVAALTAANMSKNVCKLMLEFPAFCIPDNWNDRYAHKEDIPDTTRVWNVPIGRRFFEELRDLNVYSIIGDYRKPVLIVHGDSDPIVPIDYSRKAVHVYRGARLHEISGAGHGFKGKDIELYLSYLIDFLRHTKY